MLPASNSISRKICVALFIVHTVFYLPAYNQVTSFYFRHLTSAEGLSDGVVHDIVQDKYGFIWIGTSYGLNRFDGIKVKTYFSKPGDSTSLNDNFIQSLYTDRQGNLWVGTLTGLCRFDYSSDGFTRFHTPEPVSIATIIQDKKGIIWAGTNTGFLLANEKKISLEKFFLPAGAEQSKKFQFDIRQVVAASDNTWYIATSQGIKIFNPISASLSEIRNDPKDKTSLSNDWVMSVACDTHGYLWVSCSYNGSVLDKIDLANHTVKHYTHFIDPEKKWTTNTIQKIITDRQGNIWTIASISGLSLYEESMDDFKDYLSEPLLPGSLLSNANLAIYQDRDGVIWLGSQGYGVSYFNPEKNFFNSIYPFTDSSIGIGEGWCRSVCEDKLGNLLLATSRGVVIYDRLHQSFKSLVNTDDKKRVIQYNSVRALLEDDIGDIWIGTAKGLNRYHPSTGVVEFYNENQGMPPAFFWMIVKDKNGNIWLGSSWGFFRYNRSENNFDNLSKDSVLSQCTYRNIQALYVDSHNRLWIGMLDYGLLMYNAETKEHRLLAIKDSLISDTRFSSLAEDHKGIIWIGSEEGLTAYDPVHNKSEFFSRENGLPSNRTNNIMVDSLNRIWIGTSNGLCMLNAKRNYIKRFDVNDGLFTNQFNEQAAYRTRDGLFIYPTYKGFLVFRPEEYKENNSPVPVYITSFKVSDKETGKPTEDIKAIQLQPRQNFFSLELAGLDYMNPYHCTYAYKLEPFDRDWIFTSKREINYTNVPAGDYTFRYKVITGNPEMNVIEKTVRISIAEVFYRTSWFKAFILLLIAIAAIAFFRYRLMQKEKILVLKSKAQLLEKEKALVQFENLKQQLNPHFLFNSLTSLRSLIRVDAKKATQFLDGLSKTYRYLLKSNDSELIALEEELRFVETFTELQQTRFKDGLQVKVNVDPYYYKKYIVPVTLQNLIENAIKHNTTATEQPLLIEIYAENDYITVKNNLQRYRIVETSNLRGLASLKTLYSYLTGKPVIIEENENFFTVKIPLI